MPSSQKKSTSVRSSRGFLGGAFFLPCFFLATVPDYIVAGRERPIELLRFVPQPSSTHFDYDRHVAFIIVVVGWVLSLCLHEFSHAIVAYYGGDTSVKEKGYLTFNPLKYTHPFFSFVIPVVILLMGGIGLPGGAVFINRGAIRTRWWETGMSLAADRS